MTEEVAELVLEEVACLDGPDPEEPIELDLEAETAPPRDLTQPTVPLAAPPMQKLSKFRHADRESETEASRRGQPDPDSDTRTSQLGRIALKRVRAGRAGTRRISYVARLLSSF